MLKWLLAGEERVKIIIDWGEKGLKLLLVGEEAVKVIIDWGRKG